MGYSGASNVREARELLGKGLERLQAESNVPSEVMSIASNIAQAVGALFEAEKANSDDEGRSAAKRSLGILSQTLALLQDFRDGHAVVGQTTQVIAQATSILFPLTRNSSRMAAATPAARDVNIPPAAALPSGMGASPVSKSTQMFVNPNATVTPASGTTTHSSKPPRSSHSSLRPTMTSMPAAAPASSSAGTQARASATPAGSAQASRVSMPPGPREKIEANVGATTDTNFYVGFSGEISEGGVFVATYVTHGKGTPVDLLITLPGGFDLNVPGVVQFVSDPFDFATESEPGMGVRFANLSAEQRELILRFVRKRPPMFYDT